MTDLTNPPEGRNDSPHPDGNLIQQVFEAGGKLAASVGDYPAFVLIGLGLVVCALTPIVMMTGHTALGYAIVGAFIYACAVVIVAAWIGSSKKGKD